MTEIGKTVEHPSFPQTIYKIIGRNEEGNLYVNIRSKIKDPGLSKTDAGRLEVVTDEQWKAFIKDAKATQRLSLSGPQEDIFQRHYIDNYLE